MKVTVFVPIQMEIKGENKLAEVHELLRVIDHLITISELESEPNVNTHLVTEAEIIEDTEE